MFEYAMKMQKELQAMEKAGEAELSSTKSSSLRTSTTQADPTSSSTKSDKESRKGKSPDNKETFI